MTKKTNQSIKVLLNQLHHWVGNDITIEKKEKDDLDYSKMKLEEVEIVKQLEDEDDYVDPYSIELKGSGAVIGENGETTKLPLNSYELPLKELYSIEASDELITVKTDRATYIFKK